jgi:hypothetical protein
MCDNVENGPRRLLERDALGVASDIRNDPWLDHEYILRSLTWYGAYQCFIVSALLAMMLDARTNHSTLCTPIDSSKLTAFLASHLASLLCAVACLVWKLSVDVHLKTPGSGRVTFFLFILMVFCAFLASVIMLLMLCDPENIARQIECILHTMENQLKQQSNTMSHPVPVYYAN